MRRGIVFAGLLSIVLIGIASWSRFSNHDTKANTLSIVRTPEDKKAYYENLLENYIEPSESSSSGKAEPLTSSDVVGRQLILDYVNLAKNGQVTSESLAALAERYVESIPTLVSSKPLAYTDLKIVSSNKANLLTYKNKMKGIYSSYARRLGDTYSNIDPSSASETKDAAKKMSQVYEDTAEKLKALSVPSELAEAHLNLLNTYIENASAMRAFSQEEGDPANSFAGLISIKTNLDQEEESYSKIEEILNKNGV